MRALSFAIGVCKNVRAKGRVGWWLALAWVVGCGGEERLDLAPVAGVVTWEGRPLTEGSVTFRPEKPNPTLHHPTGSLGPGGAYILYTNAAPGAPVGRYRVVVFANEPLPATQAAHPALPRSIIPPRYNDPSQSPLVVEVVANPQPDAYDLKLTAK